MTTQDLSRHFGASAAQIRASFQGVYGRSPAAWLRLQKMHGAAELLRLTRSTMLEIIRQDYIRTARAKGLKESVITIRHALRNAMIPIVTTVGLQFGFSLGGAVLVETVFSWPGIGRLLVDCIGLKDTPVVVACVLVLATMFTIINLCIDILYAFLDPRIRAQYKTAKR